MKKIIKKFQQNLQVLLKQDEFGSNCAVDKDATLSVKIRISADIQN